jgi:hypothetical protein
MTAQFVTTVRSLLKDADKDEKMALIRILGSLYAPDDATGCNSDILLDLRMLAGDSNKEVARMAVLTFTRVGFFPGADSLLRSAFQSELLSADDYHGELARLVLVVPPESQQSMLAELRIGSSAQASDKLAEAITRNPAAADALSVDARAALVEIFRAAEPGFAQPPWAFELVDATRYNRWLRAMARVEGAGVGASADSAIVARLSQPDTDPRKVLAYLLTPEASALVEAAAPGSSVEGLAQIASRYAAQMPGNSVLSQVMRGIASRVGKALRASDSARGALTVS